jgi:Fe-S-cluster containining protein
MNSLPIDLQRVPAAGTTADDDEPYAYAVDPSVSCSRCAAVCCRLTVILDANDDQVPRELTELTEAGLRVMAHAANGYCVALGPDQRSCGIYEVRPQPCRRFTMGAPYCRSERLRAAELIADTLRGDA